MLKRADPQSACTSVLGGQEVDSRFGLHFHLAVAPPAQARAHPRREAAPLDSRSTTPPAMPKALTFKGDKPKPKKRKRTQEEKDGKEDEPVSKQLVPTGDAAAEAEEDENWVSADNVSDLAGPVMLVFSSEPVMSLACDQLGTVFASKVENMVEGVASSAEPHDVRQVFIATRVVGSETDVVLKGCNGRYVQ